MASQHILVVKDDAKMSDVLQDYLKKGGYSVTCLSRGDQVLPQIKRQMPDLILLDIMLPGMDGTEVCREIRKHRSVPIIMITARVEAVDRILGLELGADDYICKPFSPREVVARVKTVLRRTHDKTDEKQIVVGPPFLDEDTFQVEVAGQTVKLTGNEFALSKTLMSRPDRVFSRAELLNRVQGYEYDGYDRTIESHVKNLRKKIATALPDQELIITVYGIGYKLTSTNT
jgi:two-component system response regulator BaeR